MTTSLRDIPSVDRVLRFAAVRALIEAHGRAAATEAVRGVLDGWRAVLAEGGDDGRSAPDEAAIAAQVAARLDARAQTSLRPVLNLTGTLLHTNLGRAPLARAALDAVAAVAGGEASLEYDLATGRRGERDAHVSGRLCRLAGAEAALAVNNNAAALMLVLNTLALRKEVVVSRGELIEIGGSFRLPEIMARAGCKLVEVGTTNRTHLADYEGAIGPRTALILRVHPSNFEITGFTAAVPEAELAALAHLHGLPLAVDLGSGALIDLAPYGLPREPMVRECLDHGADLVTFSGDKLLGGPQAGLVAGRAELVGKLARNPMKRALRCDKLTLAALDATLRLYDDPGRLGMRLPVLRRLTRPLAELDALADEIAGPLGRALAGVASVETASSRCQIGSGAQPGARIESRALVLRPPGGRKGKGKRGAGRAVEALAAAFRALPLPVIGRIEDGALWLDLRGLDEAGRLLDQIDRLQPKPKPRGA